MAALGTRRGPVAAQAGPDKSGLPVGVGVHTGVAYVGLVGRLGSELQFTALGEAVNTTARLASLAGAGEILLSSPTALTAGISIEGREVRHLALKGRAQPVDAVVLAGAGAATTG